MRRQPIGDKRRDIAQSVRNRPRPIAVRSRLNCSLVLKRYALEQFLYRLRVSKNICLLVSRGEYVLPRYFVPIDDIMKDVFS